MACRREHASHNTFTHVSGFFTLITGPGRSLSLKLSDTRVYAPRIGARLGTAAYFCKVVQWVMVYGMGCTACSLAAIRPCRND